jgi:hypothetical protein
MQGANDRRRGAVGPPFSSCFLRLKSDSSLVLLLWNFGVKPWLGEFFGFGRIWRRGLSICRSAAFGKGGPGVYSYDFSPRAA